MLYIAATGGNMISTSLFCAKPETKIVLFNSPIYSESQDDKEEHLPPLGLGYIATELNRAGIPTEIVDCVYDQLGIAETVEIINRGAFDYVGFNIFSINIEIVKSILLRLNRKVHVFLGGKVAEHIYDEVAHWGYHYPITVIIGEGELIFPSLIFNNCTEAPIATEGSFSVYRVDVNSAYYPRNLDAITLDRTLFYGREIRNKFGLLESCIIASRGCIYNCAFCGGALHSNPNITPRYRSCPNISNEIKTIIQLSPSTKSIRVLDDLFLRDRKSIITACNIFNAFPQLHWRCMAHVQSFITNLDLLAHLKKSGCDEVFIGIESGSPEMRRKIQKAGSVEDVIMCVESLLQAGISVKGYFICGFPGETAQQIKETINLALSLKMLKGRSGALFRASAFQFRPYHGTKLYNEITTNEQHLIYSNGNELTSTKKQYNFSSGNYSHVSDAVLARSIHTIIA